MLIRARAGRVLRVQWPPLVAFVAILGYAVVVVGFGLDFRPLHNDEGVTLGVASRGSAVDVLRLAVDHRHGPPLHYLVVHAALVWRTDILGLRLPSALFGILAVAVSYGFGRELLGRPGGAVVAVVTASSPISIHLGQFARGYTAMIVGAYASAWLMLVLVRTGRARWVVPYALAALMMVSAHPFGLFALLTELVLMAGFAAVRLRHGGFFGQRRLAAATAAALVLGGGALVLLRHLYAPLQHKYGVGSGSAVIDLASARFWQRLGDAASGSTHPIFAIALGAATLVGLAALGLHDRRAAVFATVWLALPLALLAGLTAASSDFAPERHLSFLLPGYTIALAGFIAEVHRRARPRHAAWIAAAVLAALLAPGWAADHNQLADFNANLRNASLYTASHFRPSDALATTAGTLSQAEDPRLIGAYAVLAAPNSTPLSQWQHVGSLHGCKLVHRLNQHHHIDQLWLILSVPTPSRVGTALRTAGAEVHGYGTFLVISDLPHHPTVLSALSTAKYLYHQALLADPTAYDIRRMVRLYRHAANLDATGSCGV